VEGGATRLLCRVRKEGWFVEEAEKRRGIKRVTGAREPSKAAVDRLHVSDTAAYALDLLLPSVFFLPNSAGGSVDPARR
jgi:hypothetical protein